MRCPRCRAPSLSNELAPDGSCWIAERCGTCGGRWIFDPPRALDDPRIAVPAAGIALSIADVDVMGARTPTLVRFALRISRVAIHENQFGGATLQITAVVPERDTGRATSLRFDVPFGHHPGGFAAALHAALLEALSHELAESIIVGGRRLLDPHVRKPPDLDQ